MKKLLLAIALSTVLTAPVYAKAKKPMSCDTMAMLANVIMTARQNGYSLAKRMDMVKGDKLLESMSMMAYDVPRFSTDKFQRRAVEKFENKWMLACLKQRSK